MNNGYRRTSGYRNWINQRCYLPRIMGTAVKMASGRRYVIFPDGSWRRA